jgi:micrococcal nuclease
VCFSLCLVLSSALAHRDPCHRWHSCPSDTGAYVCGDTGRCSECPDNTHCVNHQPRTANTPVPARQEQFTGKVVAIADGDTLSVLRDGKAVKIRLHGIDTPEKAQAFGTRARQFASDLVFGQTVTVRVRDVDRYGRLVGEVMLSDGRSLNHELVAAGLAWWYRQYAKDDASLAKLEAEAKAAKRGLWSDPHAVAPWTWRRQGRH